MGAGDDKILLTIFLKHDQSQNLHEIQAKLAERAWWERFPPPGVEIVSWYVAMGIGQIVTLRLPASRLNEVNVEIERSAWGVFTTEFYPTYDFQPVRERLKREWQATRASAGEKSAGERKVSGTELYYNPFQARRREPTDYENRLGDALEAAFADGVHDLPRLVARLNEAGVKAPDGSDWTESRFEAEISKLGV